MEDIKIRPDELKDLVEGMPEGTILVLNFEKQGDEDE